MLSNKLFSTVVEHTPLISIDLIIRNSQDEILLGLRNNRPAKGFWFVPGGRILKNETFKQSFSRLVKEELSIEIESSDATFLGPFEHHYKDNFSGDDFSTHYVVLAYELRIECDLASLPGKQHADYQWFSVTELLESDRVHKHTKWYFRQENT